MACAVYHIPFYYQQARTLNEIDIDIFSIFLDSTLLWLLLLLVQTFTHTPVLLMLSFLLLYPS
jgi:hypothetical protein